MRVYGSFSYDFVGGERRLGGSALYTSLGALSTGIRPELVAVGTRDQLGFLSEAVKDYLLLEDDNSFVFAISFYGGRRSLTLESKPGVKARVRFHDWGVINPLCREFEVVEAPNSFLDVQGFVRVCDTGRPIQIDNDVELPERARGIHANYQELPKRLPDYREVIVSYDEDGFELKVKGEGTYRVRPERVGEHSIGAGDFLLGAYVALREAGLKPLESAKRAQQLLEEFSTLGPTEWTRRKLGYSSP